MFAYKGLLTFQVIKRLSALRWGLILKQTFKGFIHYINFG